MKKRNKTRLISIPWRRVLALAMLVVLLLAPQQTLAMTFNDLQSIKTKTPYYDPNATSCSGGTGQGLGPTLEEHTLPAASGGAGLEESAHLAGGRAVLDRNGAGLALAPAGMTDNDATYYMNMRWRYRTWAWDGTSQNGPEDSTWYNAAVRKVLISDPATNKSVVASVLEAGPAPWTGTKEGQNNIPGYWTGYIDGTPDGYDGRVSGLAPAVFSALNDPSLEWTNGTGTALTYQWADQSVPAGTVGAAAASAASTGSGGCKGGGIALGNIVQTSLNFAWPDSGHGKEMSDATAAYQSAMPQYNGSTGDDEWSDCGVFVATVMVASGVDTNYPKRGTGAQQAYVQSHPDKYIIIPNVSDTSQLQAGDILIYNNGADGHTFIYTGKQSGSNYDAVGASLHDNVPEAGYAAGAIAYGGRAGQFIIARVR